MLTHPAPFRFQLLKGSTPLAPLHCSQLGMGDMVPAKHLCGISCNSNLELCNHCYLEGYSFLKRWVRVVFAWAVLFFFSPGEIAEIESCSPPSSLTYVKSIGKMFSVLSHLVVWFCLLVFVSSWILCCWKPHHCLEKHTLHLGPFGCVFKILGRVFGTMACCLQWIVISLEVSTFKVF